MKEFTAAAQIAVDTETEDDPYVEFGLAGETFQANLPTSGQVALVAGSFGEGNAEMVGAIFSFLRGVLREDGYRRLRRLVASGTVPFEVLFGGDDNNETGIVEWLSSMSAARPTTPPAGSSESPSSIGGRSTGRSPGKGSIRSDSAPGSS